MTSLYDHYAMSVRYRVIGDPMKSLYDQGYEDGYEAAKEHYEELATGPIKPKYDLVITCILLVTVGIVLLLLSLLL